MLFGKKKKGSEIECISCGSKTSKKYNFCPNCGEALFDEEKDAEDFGLLGKTDSMDEEDIFPTESFGITDKLVNSLMNSLMKNLTSQMKEQTKQQKPEVKRLPNGISISIGAPSQIAKPKQKKSSSLIKTPTENQIEKMSNLPRVPAKSSVKRLNDKIIYELNASGIESAEDVFVSKLESGYEIKAIGNKKVYVNSIPIELPLRGFSIIKNKLLIEFNSKEG